MMWVSIESSLSMIATDIWSLLREGNFCITNTHKVDLEFLDLLCFEAHSTASDLSSFNFSLSPSIHAFTYLWNSVQLAEVLPELKLGLVGG